MSIKCCLCFSIKQTWGTLSDMSKMWGKALLSRHVSLNNKHDWARIFILCWIWHMSPYDHHPRLLISSIFIWPSNTSSLVSFLILFYSLLVRVWQVSSSQKVSGPCCRNTFTVRTDWPLVDNTWTHTEQAAEHFRKWCTESSYIFYHLK